MRVADFIARRLHHLGVRDVYMVTGGAAMHLNDAFALEFKDSVHLMHHEQSCAMAADSYARLTNKPAIVNVTAGPGGINSINGVFGAYVDSLPMIVVSGQAKRETIKSNFPIPNLRQLGDQEVDIVHMVSDVSKLSVLIQDPLSIADELDNAFITATSGRQGPVWLDIPIDVQASLLPTQFDEMVTRPLSHSDLSITEPIASDQEILYIAKKLLTSRRPVLYVGSGIRLSGSYQEFIDFLSQWPIATVTGWNSNDLLWDDHPCYCGRPGTVGNRAGNFAVQYSDCVLIVGCRLNIRQVSFNWKSFAKNAWSCQVDIDKSELDKPTLNVDLKVHATAKGFFPRLSSVLHEILSDYPDSAYPWIAWKSWLAEKIRRFSPVNTSLADQKKGVNPYYLIDKLSSKLKEGSTIVCSDGTACVVGFQAANIKLGQRLFHNSGCASMGYELPAAVGAYHSKLEPVICIAGDGSIMMNLQELAIIGGLNYPIGIFLLNNKGYHSIRQTQNNYFPENPVGCGVESGLPFPDFRKLSEGFGLSYYHTKSASKLSKDIDISLKTIGPYLHEIDLDLDQQFSPKLSSKKLDDGSMITSELEDMAPFLDDDLMQQMKDEAFHL